MKDKITIVIPCKNEGNGIVKCLQLIESQTIRPDVIIADASDIPNRNILDCFANGKEWIRIIPGGMPAVARNMGANLVDTKYILFLDADIWLDNPVILSECIGIMETKSADLLTCAIRTITIRYNMVYRVFSIIQYVFSKIHPIAIGGFMLFRTEEYKRLGGFNENDKIAEDYRLSSKVKSKKFTISRHKVYTTDRRFEKKGIWYMIKLAVLCILNRNNQKFFENDYNYWG